MHTLLLENTDVGVRTHAGGKIITDDTANTADAPYGSPGDNRWSKPVHPLTSDRFDVTITHSFVNCT